MEQTQLLPQLPKHIAKTSESMIGVQAQYERGEITLSGLQGAIQDRRIQAAEEQAEQ